MNKKVSYYIFILLTVVFLTSITQNFFQVGNRTYKLNAKCSISNKHLQHGLRTIDYIKEAEDSDEAAFTIPFQNLSYLNFALFINKENKLSFASTHFSIINKNLFGNVPINISIGLFRI